MAFVFYAGDAIFLRLRAVNVHQVPACSLGFMTKKGSACRASMHTFYNISDPKSTYSVEFDTSGYGALLAPCAGS